MQRKHRSMNEDKANVAKQTNKTPLYRYKYKTIWISSCYLEIQKLCINYLNAWLSVMELKVN